MSAGGRWYPVAGILIGCLLGLGPRASGSRASGLTIRHISDPVDMDVDMVVDADVDMVVDADVVAVVHMDAARAGPKRGHA